LAVAGGCVDLLTDRGIFTDKGKEGRIKWGNFFGVKIVNAGTCEGKSTKSRDGGSDRDCETECDAWRKAKKSGTCKRKVDFLFGGTAEVELSGTSGMARAL
jgi:hypothetical protein